MLPGLASSDASGAPRVPLRDVIHNLGLDANLKLLLDAADPASYVSGQKWLDLSGGGYDFFLGADGSATSNDPTFNGAVGGNTVNYFSSDGDDFWTYDTTSEAWMNNIHKDGAKFTLVVFIQFGATAVDQELIANRVSNSEVGFKLATENDVAHPGLFFRVSDGAGGIALDFFGTTSDLAVATPYMLAISIDETAATGIGFVNNVVQAFTSTYTAPSSSVASHPLRIGDQYGTPDLSAGTKVWGVLAWEGVALSQSNLTAIYNAVSARYGL